MHAYNGEARKLLPLCFGALSLWQLGLITLIYTLASFSLSQHEPPPPTPPREGQTHYILPQPLFLRTATHERPRPSMCLNGEESSDTFPEALVLEIPAFQFQCAECRSPILTAIDPLSSCSLKCGLWTSSIKHHPRAC